MRNFNSEELWLWAFLMLIPIVLMNVLIAIVSDSYDSAMARSDRLYWLARLTLIADAGLLMPKWLQTSKSSKSQLRDEIRSELMQNLTGHRKRWQGRVLDTFLRISKDSDFKTKHLQLELQKSSDQVREEVMRLDRAVNVKMKELVDDVSLIKKTLQALVRIQEQTTKTIKGNKDDQRRRNTIEGKLTRRRSGIKVVGDRDQSNAAKPHRISLLERGPRRMSLLDRREDTSNLSLLEQQLNSRSGGNHRAAALEAHPPSTMPPPRHVSRLPPLD